MCGRENAPCSSLLGQDKGRPTGQAVGDTANDHIHIYVYIYIKGDTIHLPPLKKMLSHLRLDEFFIPALCLPEKTHFTTIDEMRKL